MAIRKSARELAKQAEKKKFFATEYSLKKKAGLSEVGDTAFVIPLEANKGFFNLQYHTVKSRKRGKAYQGFKGCVINEQKIKCKGYDEEGNQVPALCDELAKQAYETYPEKENASKRPISFSKTSVFVPVLVLGNTETDPNKKLKVSNASIKSWDFSYIELSDYSFRENFINKMGRDLQQAGVIDEEADGEELEDAIYENLDKVVIKITLIAPKSPVIRYQKEYTFIPFQKDLIGKKSGEHDEIISYLKNKDVMEGVTGVLGAKDYMTLFESEVDNFAVDYTDEELKKYIFEDLEGDAKVAKCAEEYKEAISSEDTKYDDEEVSEEELQESLDKIEGILTEDDITFDDDDMFDDDDEEDEEE